MMQKNGLIWSCVASAVVCSTRLDRIVLPSRLPFGNREHVLQGSFADRVAAAPILIDIFFDWRRRSIALHRLSLVGLPSDA